jgi:hypothetical protein
MIPDDTVNCNICGLPLARISPETVCHLHRHMPEHPDEGLIAERLAELGLSPYTRWLQLTTIRPLAKGTPVCLRAVGLRFVATQYTLDAPSLDSWDGYNLDLFGVETRSPEPFTLGPVWHMADADGYVEFTLELWSQRAYCRDSPLYAELRWRPGDRTRESIGGLEHARTQGQLRAARQGLKLLRGLPHRGRRTQTGYYADPASYLADVRAKVVDKLRPADLRTCPPHRIASLLGISEDTMHEYNRLAGIGMQDIRRGHIS